MEKLKYSKGPWRFDDAMDYGFSKSSVILSKSRTLHEAVAVIPHDDITEAGDKEVRGNARLLTFAPQMYEMLFSLANCDKRPELIHLESVELLNKIHKVTVRNDE